MATSNGMEFLLTNKIGNCKIETVAMVSKTDNEHRTTNEEDYETKDEWLKNCPNKAKIVQEFNQFI